MNCRLDGDASLNAPIREDGESDEQEVLAFEKVRKAVQHWAAAAEGAKTHPHNRSQCSSTFGSMRRVIRGGVSIGNKSPTGEVSL